MKLYAIRRRSGWADTTELEPAVAKSIKIAVDEMADQLRWIRSYIVNEPDGRLGTVCIYEAVDPGALREHARRVGMPANEILPVLQTAIYRPDPTGTTIQF